MAKPRVIIADEDTSYIIPLQYKFVKEFFNKIDLEIITSREYFEELFTRPQKAEILIVSEDLYDSTIQRHNIINVFVMMEQYEEGGTEELSTTKLFKYTSIKEIFNEVVGKSASIFQIESQEKKETQIVLVTSANGGAGKTTVSMGLSVCLTQNYKRVLYINAGRLQCFEYMFDNDTPLSSTDVYGKLANPTPHIYNDIKHTIRKEIFSYLPAFKTALISIGLNYSIYEKIALSAKKSGDFDFIVIDAESTFDEEKIHLMDVADKVVVVTGQSLGAIRATNALVSNINGINSDKYVFVCNKFDREEYNALVNQEVPVKFMVSEYIDKIPRMETVMCKDLTECNGMRKIAFLVM